MNQPEFHAAGLDKLSPEELKNLDEWLRTHQTAPTRLVTPSGTPAFYTNKDEKRGGRIAHRRQVPRLVRQERVHARERPGMDAGRIRPDDVGPYDHPKVRIKPMMVGAG